MFQTSNFTRSASCRRRAVAAVSVASAMVLLGGGPAAAGAGTSGTLTFNVANNNPGSVTGASTGQPVAGGVCIANTAVAHHVEDPNGSVVISTTGGYTGPVVSDVEQDSAVTPVFYTKLVGGVIQTTFYSDLTCSSGAAPPAFVLGATSGVNADGAALNCLPGSGSGVMTRLPGGVAEVTVTGADCTFRKGPLGSGTDAVDLNTTIVHRWTLVPLNEVSGGFSKCVAPIIAVSECLTEGTVMFS